MKTHPEGYLQQKLEQFCDLKLFQRNVEFFQITIIIIEKVMLAMTGTDKMSLGLLCNKASGHQGQRPLKRLSFKFQGPSIILAEILN